MRTHPVVLALVVACLLPAGRATAGNPIPGVGIVVKKCNCKNCCSTARIATPGGFFGPGSEPFDGTVWLEGRCSHDCGGCDNDCAGQENNPDGRLDFAADGPEGPFDVVLQPTVLYSAEPIAVQVNGVETLFHVFLAIRGPLPTDPATGAFHLPPGSSLGVGSSSTMLDGHLDVHCTITFEDAVTGVPADSPIEQDLHLVLQETGLPVTRVAGGTPEGNIVPGFDGGSLVPFTFASAGGDLVLQFLSLYPGGPVPVENTTWGTIKALYR